MITTLALALLVPASAPATPAARSDNPPVQVWLSSDHSFASGDRVRVFVRTGADGYLVVLHAGADGQIRVLFPVDPGDDAFVRGDKKYEVKSRGDQEAFVVDEQEGTGEVLAAWVSSPYALDFHEFVRGDHWDFRALEPQDSTDTESALLDVIHRMVGDNHFDYDVVSYTVPTTAAYDGPSYNPTFPNDGWGGHSGVSVAVGFGVSPWWAVGYGPYCSSYWWSTWGCGVGYWPYYPPLYYRPYYYGGYYRPWGGYPYSYARPYTPYRFGSPTSPFPYARPRVRTPNAGYVAGRSSGAVSGWSTRGIRPSTAPSRSSSRGSVAAPVRRSFGGSPGRVSESSPRATRSGGGGRAPESSPRATRSSGGGGGRRSAPSGGGGGGGGGGRRR
jgi:hypothetical protein